MVRHDYSQPLTISQRSLVDRYINDLPHLLTIDRLRPLALSYYDWDDAVAQAAIGLLKFARVYDESKSKNPSTILVWYILGALKTGLLQGHARHLMHLPDGHDSDNLPPVTSLHDMHADTYRDKVWEPPARNEETKDLDHDDNVRRQLAKALSGLDDRRRTILYRRFALGQTLSHVAKHFGISKQRTQQLQEHSLAKARKSLGV